METMPKASAAQQIFKVLIVEDDVKLAETLAKALQNDSTWVRIGFSGEDGRRYMDESSWDLLVTDLALPDISGILLLSHFREIYPESEAIVMTGYASLESALKAMELGACAFLLKPLRLQQLLLTVSRILEKISLRRENQQLMTDLKLKNTGLKESLQTLHKTQKQLVEKEKLAAVGELTVRLNHEFKNSLGGIAGSLKVLQDSINGKTSDQDALSSKEISEIFNEMDEKVAALLRLIDRINRMKKITSTDYSSKIKMLNPEE